MSSSQSTVEELETTNEELQSTNEELETINEELYSTNSEPETVNDELRVRSGQLNQSNSFLESVMESMRAGVVVLDRDLTVESWNLLAEGGDSVPTRSEARTCSPWISGYRSTSCSTGSAIA